MAKRRKQKSPGIFSRLPEQVRRMEERKRSNAAGLHKVLEPRGVKNKKAIQASYRGE